MFLDPSSQRHYYDLSPASFQSGMSVTHQGELFDLASFQVYNLSGLSPGVNTFYFGVDISVDGAVTMRNLYFDSVVVKVQ